MLRSAVTDAEGEYTMHGLPPNRYLVGINGDTYRDVSPYRPLFYPAALSRTFASPIDLGLMEVRRGIDFELQPARESAKVLVERVLEDGSLADRGTASARDAAGMERAFAMVSSQESSEPLVLNLWAGETYILTSTFVRIADKTIENFEGRLESFKPAAGENKVRIVLRPKPRR